MKNFTPDYTNIQNAARNVKAVRLPLYEHKVADTVMEKILGTQFAELLWGNRRDKEEYFHQYYAFSKKMGYDAVQVEGWMGNVMPHSGLLAGSGESVIKTYEDFEKYPWDEIPNTFFSRYGEMYEVLMETLPPGMKAIGGVGNGLFESVQEVIGYMNLCIFSVEDPELYAALFSKVGDVLFEIWQKLMHKYDDAFCVYRIGDDLGYKANTLLPADDIRRHIIPQYARMVECAHSYGKPMLLHSCGNVFSVMQDLIHTAKFDAKHSDEDIIASFPVWVEKYGKEIGNFGGFDVDALCRLPVSEIRAHVYNVLDKCKDSGGIAFGTGNSVPDYVPVDSYVEMVNAVRAYRGE